MNGLPINGIEGDSRIFVTLSANNVSAVIAVIIICCQHYSKFTQILLSVLCSRYIISKELGQNQQRNTGDSVFSQFYVYVDFLDTQEQLT